MLVGRIIFGFGGESLNIAQFALISQWFSKDEIALALAATYLPVALGESRLRTETAGIFSCAAFAAINTK